MITEQVNSDVVEPEVREAVVKAASVLGELGASVEEVSLSLTRTPGQLRCRRWLWSRPIDHHDWLRDRLQDYGHANRIGLLDG